MNRTIAFSLIVTLGLFAPVLASAQETPPAPAGGVDAPGFFRVGEYYEAHLWTYYYQTAGGKLEERFAAFTSECRRLGAPPAVLENLEAYHKGRVSLPFAGKPSTSWTPDELKQWANAPTLLDAAWKAWLDKPEYEPRFFWHLGRMSFTGWFIVGSDVLERGVDVKNCERNMRDLAKVASALSSDTGYARARARLSPRAAEALKAIAALSAPMEDPFGEGVTLDQLRTLDASARTLRDLARNKALTTPDPQTTTTAAAPARE
ncbi:MAG: hypothetical protein U0835_05055 [Isosphaeraceae bacterium]